MTLQEFYDRIGGDYKATISRLPSEALIKKFVLKYPGDPSFNQLKDALAAQDWELAFRASHTLKGVAQNLGMDRLYKTAATLCDAVRGPKPLEDASLWPPVVAAHEEVLAAIREPVSYTHLRAHETPENPGASRRGAAMLLLFSLAVSVLLGFAMPVHAADDGRATLRTLRVGFYPYTGYMATAADGSRSGYAYELLQDIAQHENVTFAYSCLDGNTQQAMQQLAAGQIDLIPVLRRTAERDEQFAFSAEPIGTVATMLTVKAGNRSIVAGDYDTFDGITVGMSRSGNGRNESFRAYAEEHGFRYTPVYYDTDEELSSALRNGEITAAASNRLRETKNEWIIDTFDEQSIYIAMRKDDTVTQQLVNDAISKINRNDPSWRTTLFNKYYTGSHTSSKINLTDAEENYVIACNDADTVFTVLVNPDRYPYSYMTPDGMPTGIMVDIFQKAAGRARLRYKFLKPADRSEYKTMLADGQADFVIDLTDDMSQAENYGYKLTDSYLSAEFSWVLLRRHNGALNNVAVAYDFSPSALEMPGLSDTAHIEYLDSFDDCLAAVHAGTVDAYYTYTYQAERAVFDDTRNELRSMLSGEQRNFCIGVRQDYDVLLRSVLNKSIDSLTRAEISTITNTYVNLGQQPFSLTRLAYQYPAIIVLTCLCVLVTAVCIALVIRAQRFRAETEKALRKAEEASVAKTEFLSNMSHDIRTPINGIMGMLDIAEDNFDNKARVRDCMTKMRGAASHLLSLINDVLDMTKIESGNMQMLDTSFDLRALLDSCCSIGVKELTLMNIKNNRHYRSYIYRLSRTIINAYPSKFCPFQFSGSNRSGFFMDNPIPHI